MRISSFLSVAAAFTGALAQLTSNLTLITEDFGENPTNVPFYIYVPKTVEKHPAIILGVHWCTGTGPVFFENTEYAKYADQYGYIVIYPSAPRESKCWDVASNETLIHNGGSDSLAITNMVKWTIKKYNGDRNRIFVTGLSSGGMMTQVLVATYPDLFKAASSYCGVPYGCFRGPGEWNNVCSEGRLIKTPEEWGNDVRNAYPGYKGPRPKLQIWHGTLDVGLAYQNFHESNKMWSNVFGIPWTMNLTDTPFENYTEMVYGNGKQYVAYSAAGIGHDIQIHALEVLKWFGIYKPPKPTTTTVLPISTTTSKTTLSTKTTTTKKTTTKKTTTTKSTTTKKTTTTKTTKTTATPSPTVAPYHQCGGLTYRGPTGCSKGFVCKKVTDMLWTCQPGY